MPFCGDFSVTEEQNIISKICCYDKKKTTQKLHNLETLWLSGKSI